MLIAVLSALLAGQEFPQGDFFCFDSVSDLEGLATQRDGKLSPFWAFEYVGLDLMAESLSRDEGLAETSIAISDLGFDFRQLPAERVRMDIEDLRKRYDSEKWIRFAGDLLPYGRGNSVANVFLSGFPFGFGVRSVLSYLGTSLEPKSLDSLNKIKPDILVLPASFTDVKQLEDLSTFGTIVVQANRKTQDDGVLPKSIANLIVANPVDPLGLIPAEMSQREDFMISVPAVMSYPSDIRFTESAKTATKDAFFVPGKARRDATIFGGAEAAAAILGAVLANIRSVLPGIHVAEIKVILERTALKNIHSEEPKARAGRGILNAFRAIEVAKRLKTEGWPEKREELLKKNEAFLFEAEARAAYTSAENLLQKGDTMRAMRELRRSFFLDPRKQTRLMLSRSLEEKGLSHNSLFYESLTSGVRFYSKKMMEHPDLSSDQRLSLLKLAAQRNDMELLNEAMKNTDAAKLVQVVQVSRFLDDEPKEIWELARSQKSEDLKRVADESETFWKKLHEGVKVGFNFRKAMREP